MSKKDLSVTVAGVKFPNPVIAASGTYGTKLIRRDFLQGYYDFA